MMDNYDMKRQVLYQLQHGRCPVTNKPLDDYVDMHHAGKPGTKWNRRRWPLLIDSVINLMLVDPGRHMGHGLAAKTARALPPRWPDWLADEIEETLIDDPDLADAVNCRSQVLSLSEIQRIRRVAWEMATGKKGVA